jgi:hypothetical protein
VPILIVFPTKLGYFVASFSGSHFAAAALPTEGTRAAIANSVATTENPQNFAMTLTLSLAA